uniref:Uncharacterized protein n=1 Tax=Arundo donax TaxID=35708 RepID=A0A0A9DJD8_ARUDO
MTPTPQESATFVPLSRFFSSSTTKRSVQATCLSRVFSNLCHPATPIAIAAGRRRRLLNGRR